MSTEQVYTKGLLTQADITSANIDTARRVLADLAANNYTPEAGCEDAIAAYKLLAVLIKDADALQAQLKDWLRRTMYAGGISEYYGNWGYAKIMPGQTRTTWDSRALDALIRSDDDLRRILEPHRTVKVGPPTLRIE